MHPKLWGHRCARRLRALLTCSEGVSGVQAASAGQGAASVDPAAARKAEEEAEERRLAEIRSHGTMVTPQTFAEWKKRFDAEMALQKARIQGMGQLLSFILGQHTLACAWLRTGRVQRLLCVAMSYVLPVPIEHVLAPWVESGHARAGADSTGERKDKGPTGKQFFRQLEADAKAKVSGWSPRLSPC